ncbi:hypothetical protein LX32DRAFT_404378 [Colletotrichum zoysiae]|uniref:Uncharacterized protein n=1 Tax=Colletotrichum zoysiae TaxID=1216348 RepID=A0AAD9HG07_9PEZI|nr:hypothetical protein LX32DRAFT_404378 [Colletotrichum zoysiae]
MTGNILLDGVVFWAGSLVLASCPSVYSTIHDVWSWVQHHPPSLGSGAASGWATGVDVDEQGESSKGPRATQVRSHEHQRLLGETRARSLGIQQSEVIAIYLRQTRPAGQGVPLKAILLVMHPKLTSGPCSDVRDQEINVPSLPPRPPPEPRLAIQVSHVAQHDASTGSRWLPSVHDSLLHDLCSFPSLALSRQPNVISIVYACLSCDPGHARLCAKPDIKKPSAPPAPVIGRSEVDMFNLRLDSGSIAQL